MKQSDYLRNQETPTVLGYELDRVTLIPIRKPLPAISSEPVALCDADKAIAAKYGSLEALSAAGFDGLVDRIKRGAA